MKPINPAGLFACLLFVVVVFSNCRKKPAVDTTTTTTTTTTGITYTITTTGSMHTGDTVQFSSNIPAGTEILWVIRDSVTTTSTEQSPKYIFQRAGTYSVIIVVDGDTGNLKGKNPLKIVDIRVPFNGALIANIAGTRHWHVVKDSMNFNNSWYKPDTITTYNDTFAITVVNSTTLVVKGDTLRNYDDQTGVFDHYTFRQPWAAFAYKTLFYYFGKDSITYVNHPYQGGLPQSGKRPEQLFGVTTRYFSH